MSWVCKFRKKVVFGLLVILFKVTFLNLATAMPAPDVAGVLSIVPGLGQLTSGHEWEGLLWLGATVGSAAVGTAFMRHTALDLWFYNMYDAYQGAGGKSTASHGPFVNFIATYNPLNIVDPIGGPVMASGFFLGGTSKRNSGAPRSLGGRILYYSFTGWGEESLFRGWLFPAFSRGFSSKAIGAIASSALFSAGHNEFGTIFFYRWAIAILWCLQLDLNHYDLRKNIFSHAWLDIATTRNGGYKSSIRLHFFL